MDYDLRHGRTYQYLEGDPLYPFGYGLSYTSFEYSGLRSSAEVIQVGGSVTVSLDVRNTGARDGAEVVQLYVRRPSSRRQELRGFLRVAIAAGSTHAVEIDLSHRDLERWDPGQRRFVVDPGEIEIRVGASSADIRLTTTVRVE
jgi:beta-glucosidase